MGDTFALPRTGLLVLRTVAGRCRQLLPPKGKKRATSTNRVTVEVSSGTQDRRFFLQPKSRFADHQQLALNRRDRFQIATERLEVHSLGELLYTPDCFCNVAESTNRIVKRQQRPRVRRAGGPFP